MVPHPSRLLRRVGSYDRTATNFRSSVLIFYARRTRSSRPACRNKLPLVGVELNAMYLTSAAHDPRAFWIELGPFCKLYFLYLGIVTICILLSLFRMLIRLRSLKKPTVTEDYELKQLMVARLRNNIDNLCQLTHFSTLLFGLIFFLQFPAILSGFGDSSAPFAARSGGTVATFYLNAHRWDRLNFAGRFLQTPSQKQKAPRFLGALFPISIFYFLISRLSVSPATLPWCSPASALSGTPAS